MIKKNILVPKTARYFVLGEPNGDIKYVWFVCHGYAQLANFFLKNFELLSSKNSLVIAPEGLHRFYWKNFDGHIVASWMTKEDRLDDINDYVNYLDLVYKEVLAQLPDKKVIVNVIGFSQGGATVSRWLSQGKSKIDNLILWASVFPPDINIQVSKQKLNQTDLVLIVGNQDEYISPVQFEQHCDLLKKQNIRFRSIIFNGKHEINESVLKQLSGELTTNNF
ncbi:MAG: alpha/beta fold hydrolase [Bacteroidia bacterium]|nr:alpha/beta fold hydrolase [Bacteroidia bacterium]